MQILLILAMILLPCILCILIVSPKTIKINRRDSYTYYQKCSEVYKKEKKYYKLFAKKEEDERK